jgi:hypothetical protein
MEKIDRFLLSAKGERMRSRTAVAGFLVCALAVSASPSAGREQAELPEFASKHLLSTMRDHLEALEAVTGSLAERDYEGAAKIAEVRLGMSSVEIHYEKHVGKYMPEGMRTLGTRMHEAATRFAETARTMGPEDDPEKLFGGLADIMEQCVACHDSYRTR